MPKQGLKGPLWNAHTCAHQPEPHPLANAVLQRPRRRLWKLAMRSCSASDGPQAVQSPASLAVMQLPQQLPLGLLCASQGQPPEGVSTAQRGLVDGSTLYGAPRPRRLSCCA